MALFQQNNFFSGLDTEFDPTKTPRDSYKILINGRARRDVIEPTNKHVALNAPDGNYQGLYVAGSLLVLFIDGLAYYADITQSPINFIPLAGWSALGAFDVNVSRIYAEIVPVTTNFLNRYIAANDAQSTSVVFNDSIAAYPQALFCFDGSTVNRPRAIFADGTVLELKDFNDWLPSAPEYVPYGKLPAVANNKLFLASPDLKTILHSVSGRVSDFMVNITTNGQAGGDANTVSATVSFNDITAIKALSNGQVLVSTLYASFALNLDYDNPIFGEPYLAPQFLFPTGALNDISIIPIAAQTPQGMFMDMAFITQSGIHSFNSVQQTQRESNNYPLGAKIKGLLLNPQSDTCAVLHDDYGFFAVNTIFGYGALVFDTIRQNWVSLDLSFGRTKQFANTRIAGEERLFFITHENQVYEAFASDSVNTSHIYLGEWTPESSDQQSLINMVDAAFLDVKESGYVKFTAYVDGAKHGEQQLAVSAVGYQENTPIVIPMVDARKTSQVGWQFSRKARAWNFGVMVEWNFNGKLSELSIDGTIEQGENLNMQLPSIAAPTELAFIGSTGYGADLNPGTDFEDGFLCVSVERGEKYIYFANGNGRLVTGNVIIADKGIFTAPGDTVAIEGEGSPTFVLKKATDFLSLLGQIRADEISTLIHGGNLSFSDGDLVDVQMGVYPLREQLHPVAGDVDYNNALGAPFFNELGVPRYYIKSFDFVDVFFYNGGWTRNNATLINGVPFGPTSEPDGNDIDSLQAAWLRQKLGESTKPFKFVVANEPPYSTEIQNTPGYTALRLPFAAWGASAVFSSRPRVMERRIVNGFPYFVCGTGGHGLGSFALNTNGLAAFRSNEYVGYLRITVDAVSCLFSFVTASGDILDQYVIYA